MQAHRRVIAAGLFLTSFVVLHFVKLKKCASYLVCTLLLERHTQDIADNDHLLLLLCRPTGA